MQSANPSSDGKMTYKTVCMWLSCTFCSFCVVTNFTTISLSLFLLYDVYNNNNIQGGTKKVEHTNRTLDSFP